MQIFKLLGEEISVLDSFVFIYKVTRQSLKFILFLGSNGMPNK